MYTIVVSFDNLSEMYQVTEYNDNVKSAIENISTYGEDCIELVFKGEIIENMHDILSLRSMIEQFEENNYFETYFEEDQRDLIENQKELLKKISI